MVPLWLAWKKSASQKAYRGTATNLFAQEGRPIAYRVGVMIEVPRAAACANEIAHEVDFMSFGTNDLTQLTFGFSRDDATSTWTPTWSWEF